MVGAHVGSADAQVVKYRRRYDGHRAVRRLETDAALFQPLLHTRGGGQSEGASPAEQDRVHLVDPPNRVQQVSFASSRRPAPHGDAADRAIGAKDDRAGRSRPPRWSSDPPRFRARPRWNRGFLCERSRLRVRPDRRQQFLCPLQQMVAPFSAENPGFPGKASAPPWAAGPRAPLRSADVQRRSPLGRCWAT